jgi:hypothetical protein
MHPTLLIGPADWDARRFPRAEFEARIDALWQHAPQAGGAIVYGNSRDHSALAYLTQFTPKLEAAVALIPRHGGARLLVGGGVNMLPAAKPLTWIEQLLPLRSLGSSLTEWARGLPAGGRLMLIGGDAMPYAMHGATVASLAADAALDDGTAIMRHQMRRKHPSELATLREAARLLRSCVAALQDSKSSGAGIVSAVIAAEHEAIRLGAQDVRSLFSFDGGRTLVPFEGPAEQTREPWQVYLAVRHAGYWAEGFVMPSGEPHAPLQAARAALQAATRRVAPGIERSILESVVAEAVRPYCLHPVSMPSAVSIGLSLEEAEPGDDPLVAGEVISLRAGAVDETLGAAIVSAMIAVGSDGNEVLWSAP